MRKQITINPAKELLEARAGLEINILMTGIVLLVSYVLVLLGNPLSEEAFPEMYSAAGTFKFYTTFSIVSLLVMAPYGALIRRSVGFSCASLAVSVAMSSVAMLVGL